MASNKKPASWRDTLPVHPAADLFPLMSPDELRTTGENIKKNGLRLPIAITGDGKLLDGRNRLDAMEAVGIEFEFAPGSNGLIALKVGRDSLYWPEIVTSDPVAYVISTNIHRRHLTAEQKRDLIAKLIKATPEKSNRQIAETAKVGHPTVARVRKKLEAKGDVERRSTSIDTKGRKQPARKPSKPSKAGKRTPGDDIIVDELLDEADQAAAPPAERKPKPRDDIGAASTGELARKDAEIEQLRNDKRLLEIKVAGLESEIEELRKTGGDMSVSEFQAAIKKWEETVDVQRGIIAQREAANSALKAELDEAKAVANSLRQELAEIITAAVDDGAPISACDGEDADLIDAHVQRGCNVDEVPDISTPPAAAGDTDELPLPPFSWRPVS
jgi:hypothetical protein